MNITHYVGNTPLVKFKSCEAEWADIFVKIEHFNAGGSIKSRVAKKMIEDAEKKGLLHEGSVIIEPTGGNTGIGLAIMALLRGYKFIAVVPDKYEKVSRERIEMLRCYNADVRLSDASNSGDSHIRLANKLMKEDSSLVRLDQFKNQACIEAHYSGTATEILKHITPDAFVAGVGSSGTFTGISKRLKEKCPTTKCFIAQPEGCDISTGKWIQHKMQGISLGIIPPLLDFDLVDGTVDVNFNDAREMLRKLVKEQGLFLGISSGTNIVAAIEIAKKLGAGRTVCTIAPDGGHYYMEEIYRG